MKALIGKRLLLLVSLFLSLSITGCFWTKERKVNTVEGLFNQAFAYYQDEKYRKAREAFEELRDNYPLSKYSIVAELRIADSYYHEKEYSEAINHYEDFRKLHPTNPVISYVIYQTGMSYFKQILSIDRDQTFTENAVKQFEYLISRHPSSTYVSSAQKMLEICKEKLAQHEFYVGHLYFKRKNYTSALYRFKGILGNFPKAGITDTVYLYIGESYLSLEEKEKAKTALAHLVENYPKSEHYGKAQKLLAKLR
ncbi:MAG: outer membrane protein assembly factor BamD [Desulfobacteria bacterium]